MNEYTPVTRDSPSKFVPIRTHCLGYWSVGSIIAELTRGQISGAKKERSENNKEDFHNGMMPQGTELI